MGRNNSGSRLHRAATGHSPMTRRFKVKARKQRMEAIQDRKCQLGTIRTLVQTSWDHIPTKNDQIDVHVPRVDMVAEWTTTFGYIRKETELDPPRTESPCGKFDFTSMMNRRTTTRQVSCSQGVDRHLRLLSIMDFSIISVHYHSVDSS